MLTLIYSGYKNISKNLIDNIEKFILFNYISTVHITASLNFLCQVYSIFSLSLTFNSGIISQPILYSGIYM